MVRKFYKFNVQSEVVDLNEDNPKPEDAFLIDTNVLFWISYTLVNPHLFPKSNEYFDDKLNIYSEYLDKAREAGSKLFYCGLSISELAHIIEKNLFDNFLDRPENKNYKQKLNLKQYRHNFPKERNEVVKKIQNACRNIESYVELKEINVNHFAAKNALINLQNSATDGYDLFILETMSNAGINLVITDDGDYVTIPGIQVFTANYRLITAARLSGKLIKR